MAPGEGGGYLTLGWKSVRIVERMYFVSRRGGLRR